MYQFVKRAFCVIACGGALIVLLPVFLIAIIGILISDWGPVFIVRIVLERITSLLGCISSEA